MHLIVEKVIPYKDKVCEAVLETSLCSALVQKQVKWEPIVRKVDPENRAFVAYLAV